PLTTGRLVAGSLRRRSQGEPPQRPWDEVPGAPRGGAGSAPHAAPRGRPRPPVGGGIAVVGRAAAARAEASSQPVRLSTLGACAPVECSERSEAVSGVGIGTGLAPRPTV